MQNEFNGDYASYLKYYCDNVLNNLTTGEKWLSADRYPLTYDNDGNKCLDSAWLSDVQILANVAKQYKNVKTNFFIQTMPYGIKEDGSPNGAIYGSLVCPASFVKVPIHSNCCKTWSNARISELAFFTLS